jgi:AcrR family transcriptional regulator
MYCEHKRSLNERWEDKMAVATPGGQEVRGRLNVPARPGRPAGTRRRGQTLETAIFEAVLEQLQTVGYGGLTMEGVAAAARTGKAALYRRWPGKDELVIDALNYALPTAPELPERGNLRDEMVDALRHKTEIINSPAGRAMQSLMAEVERGRPLVRMVYEQVFEPREQLVYSAMRRGVNRGEIHPDAITPLVGEVGPAMLVQRFLGDGGPVPDDYIVAVVDELLMPLLTRVPTLNSGQRAATRDS